MSRQSLLYRAILIKHLLVCKHWGFYRVGFSHCRCFDFVPPTANTELKQTKAITVPINIDKYLHVTTDLMKNPITTLG